MRITPKASVPYGVISNSSPAAIISRIKASPYLAGTATSYASSPEKLMRNNRPVVPPQTVTSEQAINGNPSLDISTLSIILDKTSRLLGPAIANCAHWSVVEIR